MRVVRAPDELRQRAARPRSARREAAFGVGDVYLEKYVEAPRHIEFQVLGDHHGNVVHLGERECSIQRRHQKLHRGGALAGAHRPTARASWAPRSSTPRSAVQYTNAGTFEFLIDATGNFYFIEVNTRLQVEHPVTEMVTGIDIVKEQIRDRGGRAAVVPAGGHRRSAATPSSAGSTPRTPRPSRPRPGVITALQRARRPRRARGHVRPLRVHRVAVLRLADRQDHRLRPRPARGHRPHAARRSR